MNYTTLAVAAYLRDNPDTSMLEVSTSFLRRLPALPNTLRFLKLRQLPKLRKIPDLPEGLVELIVDDCSAITEIPALPKSLQRLCITSCHQLLNIPSLPNGLRTGSVIECPQVKEMPAMPASIDYFLVLASPKLLRSAKRKGFFIFKGMGALYQTQKIDPYVQLLLSMDEI